MGEGEANDADRRDEERSDRREDPVEEKGMAFVGGRNRKIKFTGKCHKCGKVGHMQKDLLNRGPTKAILEKGAPANRWTRTKPDSGKLRIFRSKAFAWIPNQQNRKLNVKSSEGVMIGHGPNGYITCGINLHH